MRRVFRLSPEWQETDKCVSAPIQSDGDDSEAPAPVNHKTDGGQGSARKLWSDAVGEIEGQTQTGGDGWRDDERRQERLMEVYDVDMGEGEKKQKTSNHIRGRIHEERDSILDIRKKGIITVAQSSQRAFIHDGLDCFQNKGLIFRFVQVILFFFFACHKDGSKDFSSASS